MKVEELIGNLTTYELEMKFKEKREGGDTRKKPIALKGTTESDGDDDDDGAAELELIIKKFKRWNYKYGNPARNQKLKSRIAKALDYQKNRRSYVTSATNPDISSPIVLKIDVTLKRNQKGEILQPHGIQVMKIIKVLVVRVRKQICAFRVI